MNNIIVCAAFALSCSGMALAQIENSGQRQENTRNVVSAGVKEIIMTNESFIKQAAISNLAEIELSNLALRKNASPIVQSLAQRMQKDHGATSKELQVIAKSKSIEMPTELDDAHKSIYEKLSHLTGAEFDKQYSQQMQEDHDQALALFATAVDDKRLDPQLQQFAAKTLPVLRDHQQAAHSLLGDKAKQ